MESYPCRHECVLGLKDGSFRQVVLGGHDIEVLIQELAREKIIDLGSSCCGLKHFDYRHYRDRINLPKESASDVLGRVFQEALVNHWCAG